jgi:hypothetical protein
MRPLVWQITTKLCISLAETSHIRLSGHACLQRVEGGGLRLLHWCTAVSPLPSPPIIATVITANQSIATHLPPIGVPFHLLAQYCISVLQALTWRVPIVLFENFWRQS